jgi:predicted nucleotidyltransferase
MMNQPTKAAIINVVKEMSKDTSVELIYLFGSLTKLHDEDAIPVHSDVDIAIYITPTEHIPSKMLELQANYLSDLQVEYDLLSLNSVPIHMKIQIVKGECLFSRNEDRKKHIEYEIIQLWNKEKNNIENQRSNLML